MLPSSSKLFAEDVSSEQIVKIVLFVLQAQYQREAERLAEILSGFDELYINKLAAHWEELLRLSKSQRSAVATLTQIISAELDGGNSPLIESLSGFEKENVQ